MFQRYEVSDAFELRSCEKVRKIVREVSNLYVAIEEDKKSL